MRLFAKKFGHGVRQQRVRGKTKERAGTQPLALSRIRRIVSPRTDNLPDMIKELQALDESQLEALPVEVCPVLFSKGDVVACNATNVALQVARKIASCNMAFNLE